jgi:predicted nuclease of restriction endonuclease-like RecB superfamily
LDYFGANDNPWLRVLLAEFVRFEGRRQRDLNRRLQEPFPCPAPWKKLRAATIVLKRLWKSEATSSLIPARARAELFGLAAESSKPRSEVLAIAAHRLNVDQVGLERALFSDLPDERLVRAPEEVPSPAELGLRVNLALAQSVLRRAAAVDLSVYDNVRAVVRQARLRGLICTVIPGRKADSGQLSISGPFSLFRHTLVYGRALAELVPPLVRSPGFTLSAKVVLRDERVRFELGSGDPLFPSKTRQYDSRLEERFARDFAREAPDWDVIREPEAVVADSSLIFPDFLIRHRLDPAKRWLVEIAGFWTPDYISRKLASLRAAKIPNLILCIDEERRCSKTDLPLNTQVIRFRRRVDVWKVLEIIEATWR